MKNNRLIKLANLVFVAVVMLVGTSLLQAGLIYQNDFSGGSADALNGTAPTTGSGIWADQTGRFKQDGSIAGVWYSAATLSFTPVANRVYNLEATLQATSGADWNQLYMGFFNASGGDSTTVSNTAAAWIGVDASVAGHVLVNGGHELNVAGPLKMNIVLDTTGAQWISKYYVNDFYVSWADKSFVTAPTITTVGFGTITTTGGTVDSFSLTEVVPEPASLALVLVGAVALLRRRNLAA